MSSIFGTVDVAQRALDYHLARHNVLASNVANVDTPGFRPLELVRAEEADALTGNLPIARTQEAHFGVAGQAEGQLYVEQERVVQPGGDGNTVSLEREMSKVAANELRYDGVNRIVRQQLGILRYAANDGSHG
jgi:flagellar basal-body rod protein FlgB